MTVERDLVEGTAYAAATAALDRDDLLTRDPVEHAKVYALLAVAMALEEIAVKVKRLTEVL